MRSPGGTATVQVNVNGDALRPASSDPQRADFCVYGGPVLLAGSVDLRRQAEGQTLRFEPALGTCVRVNAADRETGDQLVGDLLGARFWSAVVRVSLDRV